MKTLFLSRLEWDTSQLFRKSLTSLRALTLLLVMCLSIGNVWGQVATATATDGKSYVVAAYSDSKYYALPQITSATTYSGTEVTVNSSGKVTTSGAPTWTLTKGSTAGQFYLTYTNGSTTYYLYKNGTGSSNYNIKGGSDKNYWAFTLSSDSKYYNIVAVNRGTNHTYLNYYSTKFQVRGTSASTSSNNNTSIILLELAPSYTVTAQSNNTEYGTVSVEGNVITGEPKSGYTYATPAYTVISGNDVSVEQEGDEFTVTASEDCTVQINFEAKQSATVTLSKAGTETPVEGKYVGDTYELPESVTEICGTKVFVGWSTAQITTPGSKPTSNFYEPGAEVTLATTNIFYAVYATAGGLGATSESLECSKGTISDNTMTFSTTNYTITHAKGTGSSFAAYSPWRLYQNNTLNIAGSYSIDSVEMVADGTNYGNWTSTSGTVKVTSTSGGTSKVTDINATSVTFTFSSAARWSSVKIYYTASSYSEYTTSCAAPEETFTVSFNNMGHGTTPDPIEEEEVSGGITLPDMSETGYTFGGWATTEEKATAKNADAGQAGDNFKPGADRTLYAIWTANEYDIIYKDQGDAEFSGVHGQDYPTTHTYGTATTLVDPTKAHNTFDGWFTTSLCEGEAVTELGATAYTADITLYAKWTSEPKYDANFSANGIVTTYKYYEGEDIVFPATATGCDDKVFRGWVATPIEGTAEEEPEYTTSAVMGTSAVTFYAVFATETEGEDINHDFAQTLSQLLNNSASIASINIAEQSYAVKEVKVTYSYTKSKTDAVTVAVSVGDNSWGTQKIPGATSPLSFTGSKVKGAIALTFTNNLTASKECGTFSVSNVALVESGATYSEFQTTCSATKTKKPSLTEGATFYTASMDVTITNNEDGATVYYTVDGTDPTTSTETFFTESSKTIQVSATSTVKAMAAKESKENSSIVSATYTCRYYASLEALVAADLGTNTNVAVSFENVPIKSIATNYKSERVGVYFDIQKEEKDIEIYCAGVPEAWVAGGKLSKSNLTCAWKRYPETGTLTCWELTPSNWDGFEYTNPAHITSIVISGEPTKKSYSDGQTLESDGLVVTGYYDDHTELIPHSEVITEGLTWTLPTLSEGQISANVIVKYTEPILSTELTSEAYQVTGLSVSAAKVLQSIYVADDSEHKTEFFVGRPFSSAGLKVMAKYNIGDDEPVTPTSISTPTMTSEGEQTVTITYTENEVEKQTSYDITLSYMDLNDLVAATEIQKDDYVYVKFTDQQIKNFYTSSGKSKGIFFDIQKEDNDIEIYANGTICPDTWAQYGTVSATLNNVKWTKYGDTWELTPSNWDAFSYNAPNVPVTSMVVNPASTTIGEMATTTLSIVYTPSYATNKGVTWAVTEGDEYASVDATTGEVTGLKEGSATITATLTADPSITATCAVTVTATAKCVISYVVKGEEASSQTIARSEASALTYVPSAVSGHTFVGWAESDVTEETTTPVTVITEYTPGAEEANKTLYAVYKYEDTSVEGYGNYNKITAAPADWSGKYLFVSELGNCAVKGSAITASSLSHTAVTIDKEHGVIAANDALLAEVLEVKKGTTNYTIKGGNGMYFTYNGTENGFTAATTGAIEYPIAYANSRTEITCPTSGGATMQVNENTVSGSKVYTFKFYKSSQKAMQLYKLVEGTFYYTSYPSVKYTITFDVDGGTGACPKIVVNAGENATICEDAPTKELNKFNGWSDGVNNYAAGATIENVSKDIELTAQWIAKVQYTISFDKAGAEGTTPSDITDYEGNEVTLPTKGDMSYEGYIFKGWSDGETSYAGGSKYIMPEENVTMTAVWQDASETHWALVINEKQLKAGDKVIIVAAKYDKALAAQVETKYRSVVDITKSTDEYYVTESEDEPTTLTVGITDSKITFHDGNGYLYASSTSSNYMDVQEVLDDNGKWNVTISNGVATINSVGNTSKPMMQYNAGNPRVSCYGSKQDAGDLAIYKYYETLPEYVERNLTSANIGTSCIAQGGVEEYAFSGATFYEILNKDADEKNVYFQEVTSLVAGMPYVFQPNAGAEQILMMVGGDEATAQSKNGLYGWLSDNYEFSSQIDSKDAYFVSGGKIVRCGNECTILKNRAYIVLSEISGQVSEAPGRRRLVLGVEGKGVATGMEEAIIMSNGELKKVVIDGQFYILRDGKVFDAQGKLVK